MGMNAYEERWIDVEHEEEKDLVQTRPHELMRCIFNSYSMHFLSFRSKGSDDNCFGAALVYHVGMVLGTRVCTAKPY